MKTNEILKEGPLDNLKAKYVAAKQRNVMNQQVKQLADKMYASWAQQLANIPANTNPAQLSKLMGQHADRYLQDGPRPPGTSQVNSDISGTKDVSSMYNYFTQRSREHFTPVAQTQTQPSQRTEPSLNLPDQANQSGSTAAADAAPSATTVKQVTAGTKIEMPGTNMAFTYTPQWVDSAGNPANNAVAKVLMQIASGTSLDQLDMRDLRAARRSIGLVGSRQPRKPMLKP